MTEKKYYEDLKIAKEKAEKGIESYQKINEEFAKFITENNCKRKGDKNEQG